MTRTVQVVRYGTFAAGTTYEVPEGATDEEIIDLTCNDSEWDITDGEWETERIEVRPDPWASKSD